MIDLLNKKARGEKLPKKIIFRDKIYQIYNEAYKDYKDYGGNMIEDNYNGYVFDEAFLNEEVKELKDSDD